MMDGNRENKDVSRRRFLRTAGMASAALGAGALGLGVTAAAAPALATERRAALPRPRGPRLVVVGGGTAGLTIAKYAKKEYPAFDVVLVERRDMYISCFSSNLLYSGLIDLEFLADHSYLDAARRNDYLFFNAACIGLERESRTLYTTEGTVAYDWLVLAPGLGYDYSRIGVQDPETITTLQAECPGGFLSGMEHVTIRRKVREFRGGLFVQTVPGGNYRCLAGPYERACMIAAWFKRYRIKGKVLLLDHNPDITITPNGFHGAFRELWRDYIEYRPAMPITGVDPARRVITTDFDEIRFDEAAIYPGVRGAPLLERLGLMDPATPQKEALIDPLHYNVPGDERVYVAGDSRPHPYSKSGNTAHTEGLYLARVLAARVQGREIPWTTPETACFSCVNAEPMESIAVHASYVYDAATRSFSFAPGTHALEQRDQAKGRQTLAWARGLYRDLFS